MDQARRVAVADQITLDGEFVTIGDIHAIGLESGGKKGEAMRQGAVIGRVGSTDRYTGP